MSWEPLRDPNDDVRPVDTSLRQLYRRLGLARPDVLAELERHWSSIMGSALASRCRPSTIRDGRLTVVTADPATAEQLRWSAGDLVAAIGAVVGSGNVEAVVVKVSDERRGR